MTLVHYATHGVMSSLRRLRVASWLVIVGLCLRAATVQAQAPTEALKTLSLDDLMRQDVTTVSRVPEPISAVPAAVFVITQDDIRRSGATSLPEVLRLAPGVQVSRLDGGKYAVGIRGFADRLARSMLVLIDGRPVYSPLFAGTYWEVQDVLLAEVDRIEVVRGPGGTLWGANAVNGIINIIMKETVDTQGTLVSATAGTSVGGPIAVRYGGGASANLHYRAFVQVTDRGEQFHTDVLAADGLRMLTSGFRLDWRPSGRRTLTLQGNAYRATLEEPAVATTYTPPYSATSAQDAAISGGNVLMRLNGTARMTGAFQVQAFYDRTSRDELPVGEIRDTVDVDVQTVRPFGQRHSLVSGAGFRLTSGLIAATGTSMLTPNRRTDRLYTAFVQDDITLSPRHVRLVVGSKFEHNDYSGAELQPSARLVWTMNGKNTFVASVTRAVRTPSRVETDYATTSLISADPLSFVRLLPNPDFAPETLLAYELGYRAQLAKSLYVTASVFTNHVANILSTELDAPMTEDDGQTPARTILPLQFGNGLYGTTAGGEITADYRARSWWQLGASYSYDRIALQRRDGSNDVSQESRNEGLTPRHQAAFRCSLDFPRGMSFDGLLSYSSALAAGPVPAYTASRLRFGWFVAPTLELAVVGGDLQRAHHLEWPGSTQIERAATVNLTWRR